MLKLYNTLTRQKEEFRPLNPPRVMMYTCGPTVYGPGHIGHARSYMAFDILKRVSRLNGFEVKHVLNITDVHDDMIKEAVRRGITIFELADEYIPQFHHELKDLNVEPADFYPRVTEVIPEIIEMVQTLIGKGYAYVVDDGSVYFQVAKFADYGRLSGIKLEEAVSGTRVETDKYEREALTDFALWKAQKPGEPFWDSPWGPGRPGWHIECSVMAKKFLGKTIDIHAGAMDLKFPHHENEIAQSEVANGVPFARFWVHTGLLDVEGQKMSRSLGNVHTLEDLKQWGYAPLAFRYLTLMTHYRSKLNFTREGLKAAQKALQNAQTALYNLKREIYYWDKPSKSITEYEERFLEAVNDDLNMPRAISLVWDLVKSNHPPATKHATLLGWDKVLGLSLDKPFVPVSEPVPLENLSKEVVQLVEDREQLRKEGHFNEADQIRQKILAQGYTVEDTSVGPEVRKILSRAGVS